MSGDHLRVPKPSVRSSSPTRALRDSDSRLAHLIERSVAHSSGEIERLDHSVSTLQSELERFRDLLKNYQETRDLIDRNGQIIQRASEAWVPDILEGIEEAQVLSDQVLQKLPPIEERVMQQLQEYEQGRLRAINAEAQLSWYAASWMIKLRKVLRGEVKEKPTKLLRIAAPFILSFLLLLFVGSLGRWLLRWGLLYYRNLRGP